MEKIKKINVNILIPAGIHKKLKEIQSKKMKSGKYYNQNDIICKCIEYVHELIKNEKN